MKRALAHLLLAGPTVSLSACQMFEQLRDKVRDPALNVAASVSTPEVHEQYASKLGTSVILPHGDPYRDTAVVAIPVAWAPRAPWQMPHGETDWHRDFCMGTVRERQERTSLATFVGPTEPGDVDLSADCNSLAMSRNETPCTSWLRPAAVRTSHRDSDPGYPVGVVALV